MMPENSASSTLIVVELQKKGPAGVGRPGHD